MRAEVMEWRQVFGDVVVGRAQERVVHPFQLLGELREHKMVLWKQVESKPTAGTIELRDDSRLRKFFPKKFKGIVLRGVQGRGDKSNDYAFIASNFKRIGKSRILRDILSIDKLDDRITAIYDQHPRMEIDLRVACLHGRKEIEVEDMMNYLIFRNEDFGVNRRLIIGGGYYDGRERPGKGMAFFENGRLLTDTPAWFEDVLTRFSRISDDIFRNGMPQSYLIEKLDYKGALLWRPDMIVRYIVKTSPKAKFHVNVPSELSRYCVLPDYCAVEYGEDIEIIDDVAIGNTLFLNMPRHDFYHGDSEFVMLAELKD